MVSKLFDFISSYPEAVAVSIAAIALILSIFSTILTVISISNQIKHNKISVTPIVNCVFADYEDCLAVRIQNNGLGPLIIRKFEVFKGDKLVGNNLSKLMPAHPPTIPWAEFIESIENRIISSGKEITILELRGSYQEFERFRDLVRKTLSELKIKITYESMYGVKQPLYERSLDWFGRWLIDNEHNSTNI